MFIVFGILSIIAAVFVYRQSAALGFLSALAQSKDMSAVSGGFTIVAVCMLVAGILGCVYGGGKKRGTAVAAMIFHTIASLVCFSTFVGDLQVWALVNIAVAFIYLIAIIRSKSKERAAKNDPAEEEVPSADGITSNVVFDVEPNDHKEG